MRKSCFILLSAGVTFLSSCNNENKQGQPEVVEKKEGPIVELNKTLYLIGTHSMGGIKIGMTKAEVLKLYPNAKEDTIKLEADVPCLSILHTDGSLLFSAGYEGDSITILESQHMKMKTAAGIGVGSVYTALKTTYPDLIVANIEGYVGFSDKEKISFTLEGDIKLDIVNAETMETKFISASPDTKATMILVE